MRLAAFLVAALTFAASAAWAQGVPNTAFVVGTCGTPPSAYQVGQNRPQTMDTGGRNCDSTTLFGSLPAGSNIIGKVGIDQTTPGTTNGVQVNAALPAGTNLIGKTGIDQTSPGATNGIAVAPTSAAAAAIAPIVSASAESSHVLKASAGNLYSAYVTTGATAGFLMLFDATSAPGDGAVTPKQCLQAPANTTVGLTFQPGPIESYGTGIVAVFSSSGCFVKAASATAFFHGSVQ